MDKDVLSGIDRIDKMKGNKKAEPKKRGMGVAGKIVTGAIVGITAFEGGGMAYAETTNNEHVSAHTLKVDALHPWNIGLVKKEVIPSTFDPNALESVIGPENSIMMTLEEYKKIAQPLWNAETKTMTIPIPVIFSGDRIPILHIEKTYNPISKSYDTITIGGLQEGDIVYSLFKGKIWIYKGAEDLASFYLEADEKDPQFGENIGLSISTAGLNPLIPFDHNITGVKTSQPIEKNELIGPLLSSANFQSFNGQMRIDGDAPLMDKFFPATLEGKAVLIKAK